MPLAAFTTGNADEGLLLRAAWGDPASDQFESMPLKPMVYASDTAPVLNFAQAEALGDRVASALRAGGAVWTNNAGLVQGQ
jgi:hydroxymethylbilane synthase